MQQVCAFNLANKDWNLTSRFWENWLSEKRTKKNDFENEFMKFRKKKYEKSNPAFP